MKTCTECKQQKPLDDYYFEKGKPRAKCKDCHKAKVYGRRDSNPEKFKEYMAQWRANHRDILAARERERRQREGDKINAARREKRATDAEYRERGRENQRRTRERHRDAINKRNSEWSKANRDYKNAYSREYNKRRPDVDWNKKQRRRAAEKTGKPVNRQDIWDRDGGICRLCNKPIEGPFHIDHIVPLALGGTHEPANCQLAHPACNQEKWIKLEGQIHLPV